MLVASVTKLDAKYEQTVLHAPDTRLYTIGRSAGSAIGSAVGSVIGSAVGSTIGRSMGSFIDKGELTFVFEFIKKRC